MIASFWRQTQLTSPKLYNTDKMFYNVYHSKLVVHNQLAHIFREKKWSYAKSVLDHLQKSHEQNTNLIWQRGLRHDPVSEDDFITATKFYQTFKQKKDDDFKLRVENCFFQVYSNDTAWLVELSKLTNKSVQLWSPAVEHVGLLDSNTIIKNKPFAYDYKISLKNRVDPSFAVWAKNNKDKIKIGSKLLRYIEHSAYVKSMYFYVRDEKILQLIHLMIGSSILRIDKIVSTANIDK